jgi:hypothetical protein
VFKGTHAESPLVAFLLGTRSVVYESELLMASSAARCRTEHLGRGSSAVSGSWPEILTLALERCCCRSIGRLVGICSSFDVDTSQKDSH